MFFVLLFDNFWPCLLEKLDHRGSFGLCEADLQVFFKNKPESGSIIPLAEQRHSSILSTNLRLTPEKFMLYFLTNDGFRHNSKLTRSCVLNFSKLLIVASKSLQVVSWFLGWDDICFQNTLKAINFKNWDLVAFRKFCNSSPISWRQKLRN